MVEEPLLELGFHVIRYNSRGVGRSSGWPSFTGTKEGEDLRALVNWALSQIPDVKSVVIFVSKAIPHRRDLHLRQLSLFNLHHRAILMVPSLRPLFPFYLNPSKPLISSSRTPSALDHG